jgi:HK97 family phage major capsid protein
VNRDQMRRRAKELEAEIEAKTADAEADTITKAEYREYVQKAVAESTDIADTLKAYAAGDEAKRSMSGGTEIAAAQQNSPAPQQEARMKQAQHNIDEYNRFKALSEGKRFGEVGFDFQLKTQGEANLQGENAYGTIAGVALSPGEYFLPGTAGPSVQPQFIPGILELRWYDNVIASLFSTFPSDSPVVTYLRETNWTNNAAATGEGQTFPTSTNQVTRYTAQVGKVANIARLTDETVQDAPLFMSLVNKRTAQGVARAEEVQLLAGAGYPGVEGLLGLTTSFTMPQTVTPVTNLVVPALNTPGEGAASATVSSVTPGRLISLNGGGSAAPKGSDIAVGILAMLTDIRVTHFFEPTAVVMNPYDWFTVRTWTDNNGQFMAGGPFFTDYGQPQNNTRPDIQAVDTAGQIWGKRVATTPAIPQGYILVGDFANGGFVIRKGGLRLETVNVNGYDFEQGLWTMRAYTRIGLAIERPELFEFAQLHA